MRADGQLLDDKEVRVHVEGGKFVSAEQAGQDEKKDEGEGVAKQTGQDEKKDGNGEGQGVASPTLPSALNSARVTEDGAMTPATVTEDGAMTPATVTEDGATINVDDVIKARVLSDLMDEYVEALQVPQKSPPKSKRTLKKSPTDSLPLRRCRCRKISLPSAKEP